MKPGNPPYLAYVRATVSEKRASFKNVMKADLEHFGDGTKYQYKSREREEVLEKEVHGNPNLRYESKFVEGWEPSGVPDAVEITRCVGVEQ